MFRFLAITLILSTLSSSALAGGKIVFDRDSGRGITINTSHVEYATVSVDGSEPINLNSIELRPSKQTGKPLLQLSYVRKGTNPLTQLLSRFLDGAGGANLIQVNVLFKNGEKASYNFYEAWPCRWKAPELNSGSDANWIEKIELAVEKVERA